MKVVLSAYNTNFKWLVKETNIFCNDKICKLYDNNCVRLKTVLGNNNECIFKE